MTQINWNVSAQDRKIITKIAQRAYHKYGGDYMSYNMDITACHANGNSLKLQELLEADELDFTHDISGINQHINRDNGKLENCFLPRFSK